MLRAGGCLLPCSRTTESRPGPAASWLHASARRTFSTPCASLNETVTNVETPVQQKKKESTFAVQVATSISQVSAADWDRLARASSDEYNPFLSHAFFTALEEGESACSEEGWAPTHLLLYLMPDEVDSGNASGDAASDNGDSGKQQQQLSGDARVPPSQGILVGAVPMYLKSHSYGEYVFDNSWAELASMVGESYYPKLQACVPFTPVTGCRLLVSPTPDVHKHDVLRALGTALKKLTSALRVSSVHASFNTQEEARVLEEVGFSTRLGMQFHWDNTAYRQPGEAAASANKKANRKEKKNKTEKKVEDSKAAEGGEIKSAHAESATHTDAVQAKDASSPAGDATAAAPVGSGTFTGLEKYTSFDDFLSCLRPSKRKSIRQERRSVASQGLRIRRLTGDELRAEGTAIWDTFHEYYAYTVDRKWGTAYLSRQFFRKLGQIMADQVLLVVAEEPYYEGEAEVAPVSEDAEWVTFDRMLSRLQKRGAASSGSAEVITVDDADLRSLSDGLVTDAEDSSSSSSSSLSSLDSLAAESNGASTGAAPGNAVSKPEPKGWRMVAGSLNLIGSHTLFGRNWVLAPGREFKHLHFELCYYQALEYAIGAGLSRVEAGAQGEHKIQRGYLPSPTYSSHYIVNPTLRQVVNQYVTREQFKIVQVLQGLTTEASPYKEEHTQQALDAMLLDLRQTGIDSLNQTLASIDMIKKRMMEQQQKEESSREGREDVA